MSKGIFKVIEIFVFSQTAEIGPPLGTILGNIGLNASKFCKEFNDFTSELPNYFRLKVIINCFEDKTFNFSVKLPTTGFILSLLKFEKEFKINGRPVKYKCVYLFDLLSLAKLKFPLIDLNISLKIILGSAKSAGLVVIK